MLLHWPTIFNIEDREELLRKVRKEQRISREPESLEWYTAYQVRMKSIISTKAILELESDMYERNIKIYKNVISESLNVQQTYALNAIQLAKRELLLEFCERLWLWLLEDINREGLSEYEVQKTKTRLEWMLLRFKDQEGGDGVNKQLQELWQLLSQVVPQKLDA